jgi:hypothetical protein
MRLLNDYLSNIVFFIYNNQFSNWSRQFYFHLTERNENDGKKIPGEDGRENAEKTFINKTSNQFHEIRGSLMGRVEDQELFDFTTISGGIFLVFHFSYSRKVAKFV